MPVVKLRGLNQVRKRLADGSTIVYWYAWKGGPRLTGKPGSPEFIAGFNAAIAERKTPRNDTLAGIVTLYKSKPEFLNLSASTQKEWRRWLDRITLHDIGGLSLRALQDPGVRADLIDWRDEYADRPRAADYGVQVLSRVLSFAKDRGVIGANNAEGIGQLWEASRADLIWDAESLARFHAKATAPVSQALRLACLTGLRRGDLVKLRWADVSDLAITIRTNKSKGQRIASIPLLREARELLAEIGRRDATETVLKNAHGRAWGVGSLSHRIAFFAEQAAVERSLHDARGTFATRLRLAGLTDDEIASIMGWEVERVRRILSLYVDRETIVKALIRKVASAEGEDG